MIPPHRLEQLPRSQRLRKIRKIFSEAERRFCQSAAGGGLPAEAAYLAELLGLLARDEGFSAAARRMLAEAQALVAGTLATTSATASAAAGAGESGFRRALNCAGHLLLAETGHSPADWDFLDDQGRLDPARRRPFPGMLVYLEDIRSPFNVGAMFRTAESFGVEKIFLSPLCADPGHPRARRTAMGCMEVLPWEGLQKDPFGGISSEKKNPGAVENLPPPVEAFPPGCPVFALETGGIPLAEFPFPPRGILMVGSEELGLSPRALTAADASLGRLSIPTRGAKGSLNVSVAFGIAIQAWGHKIHESST
jgi:TrmH family RNA methyltransferase